MPDISDATIVVISHDAVLRDLLTVTIKSHGYAVTALAEVKGIAAVAVLKHSTILFFDARWREDSLPDAVQEVLSSNPLLRLILITRKDDAGHNAALQQEAYKVLHTPLGSSAVANLLSQFAEEVD